MNFRRLCVLVCTLWLTSCRSTQVPAFFPAAQQYQPRIALPLRSEPEALSRPLARQATTPESEASSPLHRSVATAADTSRRAVKKSKANQPTLVVTGNDTLVGYPVNSRIPLTAPADTSAIRPDPETTFVNVIGGVLVGTGLVSLAVGSGTSGWGALYWAVIALTLIPIGLILLLYQGKNGRLRLKREARRQARVGAQAPAVAGNNPPRPKAKRNPLRKLAAILLLIGGILLLAGLLTAPYGMFFFGLPGTITLIAGLIVTIASL